MRGLCLDFNVGIEGKVCSDRFLRGWRLICECRFCREYPKPGQQCVPRTQRNNEDTPTPASFHATRKVPSLTSAVNTDNLLSSSRAVEGHGNATNNISDETSSVSAAPSASYTMSRYSSHASIGVPLDPEDVSTPFVPYRSDILTSRDTGAGYSRVLHRPMLSDGESVSEKAKLGQCTTPVSQPSSYTTACRSIHPLLVDPRMQGRYQSIGSNPLPTWYPYHRARDTSLEELETRYLKILSERSRLSGCEPPLAPKAPARQPPTNQMLEDTYVSMDLPGTASEEAKKIVHEISASELLNPFVSQGLQLKLQDSLRRSLESLEGRYQDNLQRALASLNLQNKDGDVRWRESENGKVAIDEERHKCLDCNKVKKTHSELKCVAYFSFSTSSLHPTLPCITQREDTAALHENMCRHYFEP